MKIMVYAQTSPEDMFDVGKKAGLSEEAANMFRYFEEVKLELDVTEEGLVLSGRMLWEK